MFTTARPSRIHKIALAAFLMMCAGQAAQAQLNENCMVSVLNRSVRANKDGSWVLPNIPAGFGLVKARATCVQNGVTRFGESDFFNLPANGVVNLPKITLGTISPIPTSLSLSPSTLIFSSVGQTMQLGVTATYPNGSTKDVTAAATGTNYTTSNAAIATVSPTGLVTAVTNGVVLIEATNDGTPGFVRASIVLSGTDTDGDGIPDADEIALGLDPRNPVDAEEDFDRDGLTNKQEYQLGTNIRKADSDDDGLSDGQEFLTYHTDPLVPDTDGDRIPDGVEVTTNTNPLDRNSYDLKRATASSIIQPSPFVLVTNLLFPDVSQLLSWKATLIDGKTTLDLIADSRTTYLSSNLTICNFGTESGRIYAGQAGSCAITLTNNTLSQTVLGSVRAFTPVGLSYLDIPGFANNVDVSGNFAYVAAGPAGLQIVDTTLKLQPHIAASLSLAGNANDVVIGGNFAYIAAGNAGLHVVNVSNPLSPVLAGSLNTGGVAWDVVVKGNRAYVANGANGLVIIDVSSPSTPVKLGSINLVGTAKGVDVDPARQIAALAMGTNGIAVVNVSNPASPTLLSTLDAPNDDVRDIAVSGNFAFLADFVRSFTTVDLTNPNSPALLASTPKETGGFLMDVTVVGTIAAGADVFFVNGVPLIDVTNPATPQPRAILNMNMGIGNDLNGTGIALDSAYVYLTAETGVGDDNGTIGFTRLFIGQYRGDDVTPPTVTITAPANSITVTEGASFDVTVVATDNLAVASVSVLLDGQVVGTSNVPPYQFSVTTPIGQTSTTLSARATDFAGNSSATAGLAINVAKDTVKPTVRITSPVAGNIPASGVITQVVDATDDVRVTRVEFLVNDTIYATRTAPPYEAFFPVPLNATSFRFGARAADPAGNVGVASDVSVRMLPNTFSWAKRVGGTGSDFASGIRADSAGNSYIAGTFQKTVSFGSGTTLTAGGDRDAYVAKHDTAGTLLWARQVAGGTFAGVFGESFGNAIAVDAVGNSYITGMFNGTITFGPGQSLTANASLAIFLAKYDTGGNVVWAKQSSDDSGTAAAGRAIAIDSAGNSYVTGDFQGTLTLGPGITLTSSGGVDLYVAKYDGNGNAIWAKQAARDDVFDGLSGIAVDGTGNSYVTGDFRTSMTFPGLPTLTEVGGSGAFIAKYDLNGSLVWAKRAGDNAGEEGAGIAVDNSGNSYLTGVLGDVNGRSTFLVKYDTDGNVVWTQGVTHGNNGGGSQGITVATDNVGNSYVMGVIGATETTFGPGLTFNVLVTNFFVAKYDRNGALLWVNLFNLPNGYSLGGGITVDPAGNSYIAGAFVGNANFAPGTSFVSAGDLDIFIAKYGAPVN